MTNTSKKKKRYFLIKNSKLGFFICPLCGKNKIVILVVFFMLINVKMPTIVGLLTFMNMINVKIVGLSMKF